jgi:hypothetical protein
MARDLGRDGAGASSTNPTGQPEANGARCAAMPRCWADSSCAKVMPPSALISSRPERPVGGRAPDSTTPIGHVPLALAERAEEPMVDGDAACPAPRAAASAGARAR